MFDRIATWFRRGATVVGSIFIRLFGADASRQFAAASLDILKSAAGQIALDTVRSVAGISTFTNAQKRTAAFTRIAQVAKDQGLSVPDSLINLLIELALQALKGQIPEP